MGVSHFIQSTFPVPEPLLGVGVRARPTASVQDRPETKARTVTLAPAAGARSRRHGVRAGRRPRARRVLSLRAMARPCAMKLTYQRRQPEHTVLGEEPANEFPARAKTASEQPARGKALAALSRLE